MLILPPSRWFVLPWDSRDELMGEMSHLESDHALGKQDQQRLPGGVWELRAAFLDDLRE